jgi:hypothetical protein
VLAEMVSNLEPNQVILEEKFICGWKSRRSGFRFVYWVQRGLFNRDEYLGYFFENDAAIREDFDFWRQTENQTNSKSAVSYENIFIEEGAKLEFVTLNALSGPIYMVRMLRLWKAL